MGANFDVTAILKANVSDFKSGLKEAQASLVSLKNQTGSSLEKLSGSINTVGDSMMKVGAGMTAGFTLPVAGAVGGVIKSFANLEQALGGVETLFKDSAGTVIKNSETAYKRAGISGVKYMEQVTSFSASLLQGLGGDTVQASKYADMAIVDMADNANKFGTNIQDIQNAYQGFAKDNYTMLDNLKLGYGGTQEEMARLVNESGVMGDSFKATAKNVKDIPFDKLIQAIHVTQERMGITGTTAKEASETVAGSFESMKASAQNLVAGLGQKNADIKTLMENLKDSIITFKDNIVRVLGTIWDNLPLKPWQKWVGAVVVSAGPILTVVGTITKVVGGIVGIVSKVSSAVSALITGFQSATAGGTAISGVFGSIGSAIGAISGPVWVVIGLIALFVAGLVGLYKSSEEFRDKVNSAFQAVSKAVSSAINEVVAFVKQIFGSLISWWNENHQLILQTAETIWSAIKAVIETIVNAIAPVIEAGWNAIVPIVTTVWNAIKNAIETVLNVILGIIKLVMQIINGDWSGAWETIKEITSTIWEGIKTGIEIAIQGLIAIIQAGLNLLKEIWTVIWNVIATVLQTIWDLIVSIVQTAIQVVSDVINAVLTFISDLWNNIWNGILTILQTVWNAITGTVTTVINAIKTTIETVLNTISNIWNTIWGGIKDFTGSVWDGISSIISGILGVITGVITSAWNGISSFLSGIMSGISSLVSSTWNGITSGISGFMSGITSTISNGWNTVVSTVTTAGSNIVNAVTTAFSGAVDGARNFISGAIDVGANLINGFVDGVKNFAGNLINAVGDAVSGAINWAKNLLGIHSPSRVFKQFGIYTDQGFINGVDSKAENVAKSVGGMAQGAIDAFTNKDLSGVFQDELSTVEGALGSLTAYDPNVNFDGGILTVNQQPADITLKLGSTTYRAFTNDITREQEMELILGSY
nr:MAG TPA: tail tape measure protein [Caudoviricetes sp.]